MTAPLRAPFPYFGGKRRVASLIWQAFGADVPNYVEPFAGSLAVLLARPGPARVETVNDLDAYLTNFWRAVRAVPEEVARWADWPVSELDLHARHRYLVGRAEFRERLRADPEFYDAKVAGWWVWGLSQWIGSGWCCEPSWEGRTNAGRAPRGVHGRNVRRLEDLRGNPEYERRPNLSCSNGVHQIAARDVDPGFRFTRPSLHSQGTHARGLATAGHEQRPDLTGQRGVTGGRLREQIPMLSGDSGATGRGTHAGAIRGKVPHLSGAHGNAGMGVHASGLRTEGLYRWMEQLQERLRWVRVCCGDFERVLGPSVTEKIGVTAVLLDPPYKPSAGRDPSIYAEEDLTAATRAQEWALANGANPKLRIALCGYEGEHEMPASWRRVAWKASGGYAASAGHHENARRERIWFSPGCRPVNAPEQGQLFQEAVHG